MVRELQHSKHVKGFGVSLSDDQDNNEVTTETRHRFLIALARFFYDFRIKFKNNSKSELFSLPSSRNIPFISMMDLPTPSSLNATGSFATCHLSKMTSKEFFEDSLWSVYQTLSVDIRMTFSYPTRGIEFIGTQTEAHPSKLSLCGAGSDRGGDFTLEGSVAHETGRVHLVKWYIRSTPDTYLSGLMTPFGIVGVCSEPDTSRGDWFWLWKDAWTRERESLPHAG